MTAPTEPGRNAPVGVLPMNADKRRKHQVATSTAPLRARGLEDTADDDPIREHVKIIVAPLPGRTAC